MTLFARCFFLILFIIGCNQSENNNNTVIAKVGEKILKLNEFRVQYSELLRKSGAEDNLIFRNKLLDNEIDRLVILSLSDSLEFDKSPELLQKINRAKNQTILDEFYNRELYETYQASDSLLRDAFIRSKTDVNARHLYAKSLEKANQLKAELSNGASFEKLSKMVFRDSILSQNGGDLGYFSFGDVDPDFEDAVFSLKNGEISNPVKTRQGYSIIQVLDRWVQPLITEQDYQLHKDEINAVLRSRNIKNIKQTFTNVLIKDLELYISKDDLITLFDNFPRILTDKVEQYNHIQLSSTLGIWTGSKIIRKLRDLSSSQIDKIKAEQDLLNVLKGIIVREKIIHMAQKQDWFLKADFQSKLIRRGEDEMIQYTVSYFKYRNKKSWEENYVSILKNFRENLSIYIDQNIIRSMVISS